MPHFYPVEEDGGSSKSLTYTDIIGEDLPISYILSFDDESLKLEYREFNSITKSSSKLLCYSEYQFLFMIIWVLVSNLFYFNNNEDEIVFIVLTTLLIITGIILSICIQVCQLHILTDNSIVSNIRHTILNRLSIFEWFYSIIICLTPGLSLVGKAYIGHCKNDNVFQFCNPLHNCYDLPPALLLLTYITPLATKSILNIKNRAICLITWLISFFFVFGAMFSIIHSNTSTHHTHHESLYYILFFYILNGIFLYESEYDNRYKFILWKKNKMEVKQDIEMKFEQNISSNLSDELRNIISNTAHDMKSPCTGVLLGLESLASSLQNTTLDNLNITKILHLELIHYMNSTIAFMMMSINRSMDFTKIQGRLELTPVYENIELSATIHWAIDCVTWQNETQIKLNAFEELHGFTDKTWLKDNLLCYIGNAVKFTKDGSQIIINVIKHTIDDTHTEIEIQVIDNGPLLNDIDRSKFFLQPSQRFRKQGGLGLGLYVLSHRVKALHGDYGNENRKDGLSGSIFWFRIPFQRSRQKSISDITEDELLAYSAKYSMKSSYINDNNSLIGENSGKDDIQGNTVVGGMNHATTTTTTTGVNDDISANSNSTTTTTIMPIYNTSLNSPFGWLRRTNRSQSTAPNTLDNNASTSNTNANHSNGMNSTTTTNNNNSISGSSSTAMLDKSHDSRRNTNTRSSTNSIISLKSLFYSSKTHSSIHFEDESKRNSTQIISSSTTTGTTTTTNTSAAGAVIGMTSSDIHIHQILSTNTSQHNISPADNADRRLNNNTTTTSSDDNTSTNITVNKQMIKHLSNNQNKELQLPILTSPPSFMSSTSMDKSMGTSRNSTSRSTNNNSSISHIVLERNSSRIAEPILRQSGTNNIGNTTEDDSKDQEVSNIDDRLPPLNPPLLLPTTSVHNLIPNIPSTPRTPGTPNVTIAGIPLIKSPSITALTMTDVPSDVLVVDDSIPILKMTCYVLTRAGCTVSGAKNGSVAVTMMKAKRYDLVLMDIQMPVMSGIDAVAIIRAYEQEIQRKRQIIIGMSANAKGSMRRECILAGFDGFTAKPFTYEEILKLYRLTLAEMEFNNTLISTNNTTNNNSNNNNNNNEAKD